MSDSVSARLAAAGITLPPAPAPVAAYVGYVIHNNIVTVSGQLPFVDGKLCVDTLKQQIEFQIDAGTTCIVPCGTTGESPTLSHPEHERVISETIQIAATRIKVVVLPTV